MAIWERNGHILEDAQGHPIECPWCPCGDMTCDDVIAQKIAACEAAGAYYMRQAGFLYSLVDTTEEVIASIFHWISWTYDASRTIYVCNLNYLDCDCEEVLLLTMEFAAPPATIDLFGYAFLPNSSACAGGCEEQIATLIAQAVASGWTLHGEGVMVRKTSVNCPCYRFDLTKIPVMACADTGSPAFQTSTVYRMRMLRHPRTDPHISGRFRRGRRLVRGRHRLHAGRLPWRGIHLHLHVHSAFDVV